MTRRAKILTSSNICRKRTEYLVSKSLFGFSPIKLSVSFHSLLFQRFHESRMTAFYQILLEFPLELSKLEDGEVFLDLISITVEISNEKLFTAIYSATSVKQVSF